MKPTIAIAATVGLVYRAYTRKSLTPLGIVAAVLTAAAHAVHPWSVFYTLLIVFFLAGTAVTKVKHEYKQTLTTSSLGGSSSTPAPRNHIQVLANSLTASVLILAHCYYLKKSGQYPPIFNPRGPCFPPPSKSAGWWDLLPYGIYAQYAAVAADTFSSELGILSSSRPFLITDVVSILKLKPRRVPHGTNGGVSLVGLLAGVAGAALIGVLAVIGLPYCDSSRSNWTFRERLILAGGITAVGTFGSVLDSVLGGLFQASVVDGRTKKIIEGDGGGKVLYKDSKAKDKADRSAAGRSVLTGLDLLSNNEVNFLMALGSSLVGLLGASIWTGTYR